MSFNNNNIDMPISTRLHIHFSYAHSRSPPRLPAFGTADQPQTPNRFSVLPDYGSGYPNATDGDAANRILDEKKFLLAQLPGATLYRYEILRGDLMLGNGCRREDPYLSHKRSLRLVQGVIRVLGDLGDVYDEIIAREREERKFLLAHLPGAKLYRYEVARGDLMLGNGCSLDDPYLSQKRWLRIMRAAIRACRGLWEVRDEVIERDDEGGVPSKEVCAEVDCWLRRILMRVAY